MWMPSSGANGYSRLCVVSMQFCDDKGETVCFVGMAEKPGPSPLDDSVRAQSTSPRLCERRPILYFIPAKELVWIEAEDCNEAISGIILPYWPDEPPALPSVRKKSEPPSEAPRAQQNDAVAIIMSMATHTRHTAKAKRALLFDIRRLLLNESDVAHISYNNIRSESQLHNCADN